jgi:hypothetical protein
MVLVSVSASRVVVGEAVTVEVDSAELVMCESVVVEVWMTGWVVVADK